MKQNYRITLMALHWHCILTVDESLLADIDLLSYVKKRANWDYRLKLSHQNELHCYMQLMAEEIFYVVAKAHGMIALPDVIEWFRNREDFLPADPGQCITIHSVRDITLTALSFWISKTEPLA